MLSIKQLRRSLYVAGCGTESHMSSFQFGYFSSAFLQCYDLITGMGNLSVERCFWDLDVCSVE